MTFELMPLLQRLKGWRLSTLVTVGAMLGALLVVSIMELILRGEIGADYLLTGLVTVAVIAPPCLVLLSYLLQEQARQQLTYMQAALAAREDISAREHAKRYEQFRSHTLELLAGDAPLVSIMEAIVRGVEQINPAMLCSILLLDSEGKRLGQGVAPSLPDFYNAAIDGLEIGVGICSCGTAAFTGERVIVEDIQTHPYWTSCKALAARAGLGSSWSQPIHASNGRVLGTFAIYHHEKRTPSDADISLIGQSARLTSIAIERSIASEKLRGSEQHFRSLIEAIPDAIFLKDRDSRWLITNAAAQRLFQLDAIPWHGKTEMELAELHPEFRAAHEACLVDDEKAWQAGDLTLFSETVAGEDGRQRHFEVRKVPIFDAQDQRQALVIIGRDISAHKEHERQLAYIAHYDVLTSLPNRVLLADRMHQAMSLAQRHGQKLAVAYLDLDGFKAVNDKHGHDAGDQLLIALATRMKQTLREGDTLARIGGDEFVAVLLDLADIEAGEPILTRLLAAAAEPVLSGDFLLQVSASLGVTFYPQVEDVDADQLLRQADQAMYQAKLAGKNRHHVFDAELDRNVRGYHESLEHIRRALAEREFVLHYQPKVNLRTGAVIGAEALIRWQHPERGLLPPAAFLPVIEDHPLAIELGEWVINSALAQMAHWHAGGLDIPVSVNVSARQLQQPNFVMRLREILAAHPKTLFGRLELEVLETSALEDLAHVSRVIKACQEIGVKFALDDFGTGYSSLTYLKRFPVSMLKIDQSFVHDMLSDPDDLAIVEGVLSLATAFHRQVIAEGVETVAHGTMLLQLGCEMVQGYIIARPMPASQFPDWCAGWRLEPAWVGLPTLSRDDLPMLFAGVEYFAWIEWFAAFLKGESETPPQQDRYQCRFSTWLDGVGLVRYGALPVFQVIASLDRDAHMHADELMALSVQGRGGEALARIDELLALRDALLVQLQALAWEIR